MSSAFDEYSCNFTLSNVEELQEDDVEFKNEYANKNDTELF